MAGPTVVVSVLADSKKFTSGMKQIGDSTSKLSKGLKAVGLGLGAALAGATAALGAFAVVSFKALAEIERLNAQTGAVLKSTGEGAGRSMEQVLGLADSLEKLTGKEAEQIQVGQNMLLTFTQIKGTNFDAATKSMLDLSVAMGTDTKSAATLVGKALNDPIKGVSALSRVGVQLTEDQKKLIEQLVKTGDVAGAQTVILGELNTQFGGSAEAFGNTFLGSLEKAKNSLGTIGEAIVSSFLGPMTAMFNRLNEIFLAVGESPAFAAILSNIAAFVTALFEGGDAANTFGQVFAIIMTILNPFGLVIQALAPLLPQLASAFSDLGNALGGALASVLPTVSALLGTIIDALSGVLAAVLPVVIGLVIQLADMFARLAPVITPIITLIAGVMADAFERLAPVIAIIADTLGTVLGAALVALEPLITMAATLVLTLLEALTPIIGVVLTLFEAFAPVLGVLGELIAVLLPPLIELFMALLGPILSLIAPLLNLLIPVLQWLAEALGFVIGFVVKVVSAFVSLITGSKDAESNIKKIWTGVLNFFKGIPKAIGNFFAGAVNWLRDAGRNIIQGLLNGVKSLASNIGSFFLNLLPGWIVGPFKVALGIRSPSKLFEQFGRFIPEGLIKGVRSGLGSVTSVMGSLSSSVSRGFNPGLSLAGSYAGAASVGNRYEIHLPVGMPTAEAGRAIKDAIEEYERLNGKR